MQKPAFTLAEVLITLAIIGVVAALTVPTVINNYQKTQTVTRLKKSYSMLKQTNNLIISENGGVNPYDDIEEINKTNIGQYCSTYWEAHLKILKKCKSGLECGYIKETPFKQLNVAKSSAGWVYANDYGCTYKLADGTILAFVNTSNFSSYQFLIDMNGEKLPNTFGRDVFIFNAGTLKPAGVNCGNSFNDNYCNAQRDNTDGAGFACTTKIMCDGWEIKY